MDRKRMLKLADAVEGAPYVSMGVEDAAIPPSIQAMMGGGLGAFTMSAVAMFHRDAPCGTAGCIAGWALSMFGDPEEVASIRTGDLWDFHMVKHEVGRLLGLDFRVAEAMIIPSHLPGGLRPVAPEAAAFVLRRMVDMDKQGEVLFVDVDEAWTVAADAAEGRPRIATPETAGVGGGHG